MYVIFSDQPAYSEYIQYLLTKRSDCRNTDSEVCLNTKHLDICFRCSDIILMNRVEQPSPMLYCSQMKIQASFNHGFRRVLALLTTEWLQHNPNILKDIFMRKFCAEIILHKSKNIGGTRKPVVK